MNITWNNKVITAKELETLNKRRAFFDEKPYMIAIDNQTVTDDVAMRMIGRTPHKLRRKRSEALRNGIALRKCRELVASYESS